MWAKFLPLPIGIAFLLASALEYWRVADLRSGILGSEMGGGDREESSLLSVALFVVGLAFIATFVYLMRT